MRYFFDTSALAKRYHTEPGTDRVDRIFGEPDRLILVSKLTLTEMISVAGIKQRTGFMTRDGAAAFLRMVEVGPALGEFTVFEMTDEDYSVASGLLRTYAPNHGLKTLDALHLASALRRRAGNGVDLFVTSDRVLAKVATLQGFATIVPEGP